MFNDGLGNLFEFQKGDELHSGVKDVPSGRFFWSGARGGRRSSDMD